jgi:protein phosphatase 2C
MQGKRPHMEDRFLFMENFHDGYTLMAVFDGHGGSAVADHCLNNIGPVLKALLGRGAAIDAALSQSFLILDDILETSVGYATGTTCLVVMKHTDHVWVANCGDSRAMMNKGNTFVALSHDHKPIGAERIRVERLGGHVSKFDGDVWRVNSELAVSRAIGDKRLQPMVTPIPEVLRFDISNDSKFIILATDGLWDIATCEEVNRYVLSQYNRKDHTATDAQVLDQSCKWLLHKIHHAIQDNTTVLILHLRR